MIVQNYFYHITKEASQMAYILQFLHGSFDHYSDFPHTTNPETATKETLNSDVPSTYIFPLNVGKHVYTHHSTLIIS